MEEACLYNAFLLELTYFKPKIPTDQHFSRLKILIFCR